MARLEKLKQCASIQDFAQLLGFKPKALAYILYELTEAQKYTLFTIPKKAGGTREIMAPVPQLKLAQKRLADILYDCVDELSAETKRKPLAHGFRRKLSIATNAHVHRGARYVFNIDLQDFFPSFNFGRVRGYFIKNKDFALHPTVATLIAQLACHDNQLPQGSPCSPIISNLIGHILDVHLVQIAMKNGCSYSRYADDITFSTKLYDFPSQIAYEKGDGSAIWNVGDAVAKIVAKAQFKINPTKTRMQYRESRQVVTGLTVNRHANIRKEYYKHARAMCHSLVTTGAFHLPGTTQAGTISQLEGILGHITHIKDFSDHREDEQIEKKPLAPTKVYQHFLQYQRFYALKQPLLICEGKTDSIYLKCALKKLKKANPKLISPLPTAIPGYKITFHNYVQPNGHPTRTTKLLKLFGGSGGLKILMADYGRLFAKFGGPLPSHPVILVIDNDDGAKDIYSMLKQFQDKAKKADKSAVGGGAAISSTVDGMQPFYHVLHNLYVVPTPKATASTKTNIEKLFDPALLKVKIGGKTFNPENNQSGDSGEYGKAIFASFVQANQVHINFDGFQTLLTNIKLAFEDYDVRLITAIASAAKSASASVSPA